MLVSELKQELEKYDKKELIKIAAELYKRVSKAKKEEYQIDEFIKDFKLQTKPQEKKVSLSDLQNEILEFLSDVDQGYYASPNRKVSKKERSGWRFKVKRYYKELISYDAGSMEGVLATDLLIEIYKRISRGSNYLLFANWETFRAIGVSQYEYSNMLFTRILSRGHSEDTLKKCIDLLGLPSDPYESLSRDVYDTFISHLVSSDDKHFVIQVLMEKVGELEEKKKEYEKQRKETFYLQEEINDCTMCILDISILLGEIDKGIKYYHKYYDYSTAEVKEYVLLEELERYELYSEWIQEYERHSLDYRDTLQEKYKKFKCKTFN